MQRDWTVLLHSCFHISFCCFIFLFYLTKDPMSSNVLVILFSFSMNILLQQKAKAKTKTKTKTKLWHRNEPGRKQYEELYQVKTEKHYLRERENLTSERQTNYVSQKKSESFEREIECSLNYRERSESEMSKRSSLRERERKD